MTQPVARITERLHELGVKGEKALTLFITAGYPRKDSTSEIALELEAGGADIIEIGMPFSDPLADGPVIQESSAAALRNGVTLDSIFDDVRSIRKSSGIPIVLMGYLNPILRYGTEDFFRTAGEAGVDGIILPEVPKEESGDFAQMIHANDMSNILLVAPTTPDNRIAEIDSESGGFLYCVSTTGVTGRKTGDGVDEYISRVKSIAKKNPVLVGFGVSTPSEARRLARHADGVIIGSALIQRIANGYHNGGVRNWVKEFKDVLR